MRVISLTVQSRLRSLLMLPISSLLFEKGVLVGAAPGGLHGSPEMLSTA